MDAVGVAAAGVFIVCALPELAIAAAAGSGMAALGIGTGFAATSGAILLFGIDSTIYGAEISGNEAFAKKIEDNPTVGWIRIGATLMLLPDLPVGGLRALKEIGTTAGEASEALAKTAKAEQMTGNALRDLKNVTNPKRHPAEVARLMDKARNFQAEASMQSKLVDAANAKINMLFVRDVAMFPGATVGGAGMMAAAPPAVVLSDAQSEQDENLLKAIMPKNGMPKDLRLDFRIIGLAQQTQP